MGFLYEKSVIDGPGGPPRGVSWAAGQSRGECYTYPLQWVRGGSGAKAPPIATRPCGIISENTKTITLRILHHLKLAPTHLLMPESRKADLLPSTHLTGTVIDLPWITTSSNTNFPHTIRKMRNIFLPVTLPYKHRHPLPHQTPIPSSCYPSPYLNSPPRSRNCFLAHLLAFLESLIGCYKLETLYFSPRACSYYSSMAYRNPTCNLTIGNSASCNPSTKAMPKTKLTLPPTGDYMSMTPWLNSLKVSS